MTEETRVIVRPLTQSAITVTEAAEWARQLDSIYRTIMRKGQDYDKIPGTDHPSLLKPGAELLAVWTGTTIKFRFDVAIENWDVGFFAYRVVAEGYNKNGEKSGEGVGSANSLESKYRYRWVWGNELSQDTDKTKLMRKYTKTKRGSGWKYRIENDNPQDVGNTVLKIAAKRAKIDLMLTITGASRIFTQDVEDMPDLAEPAEATAPVDTGQPPTTEDERLLVCWIHKVEWQQSPGFGGKGMSLYHKLEDGKYCNFDKLVKDARDKHQAALNLDDKAMQTKIKGIAGAAWSNLSPDGKLAVLDILSKEAT